MNRRAALFATLALAIPSRGFAQTGMPRVALVDSAAATADMAEGRHPFWGTFFLELRRLGRVEGKDIAIERWSGGGAASATAYRELGRKIVASNPTLIVVRASTVLIAIASETKKIPIVAVASIPRELYADYARPGGNVTGVHNSFDAQQLYAKQIEVLASLLKPRARIAWLGTKALWERPAGDAARRGAEDANVLLQPVFVTPPVSKPAIRAAFADIAKSKYDGLLISPASELFPYRDSVTELAAAQKLPSLGINRFWAEAGAMVGYGTDYEHVWRRAASYVDKILKGVPAAEIPIENPDKVELVINLETAKTVGVLIPQRLLLRADKVIE